MAIDTSIYNNLLRAPKSVAEYDAEAMQGQQNRLALQSQRMQMADRERGLAEDAQMRGVVAGFGADKTANYNALLKTGNIKAAQGYEEQNAKTAKVQREAEKEQFAVAKQKLELINNAIAGSKDPQSYAMNRQMLQQQGIDISQIPEQFDPAYIANAGQQALSELQRVDQMWKAKGFDLDEKKFGETVRNNKAQERTSAGNLAVAQGNLKVSRDRLTTERAAPRGVLTQTEDGPILVDPRTGRSMPVIGSDGKPVGKTKAPTEFQGKSAIFGARADESDKVIDSLAGKFSPSAVNAKNALEKTWLVGGAIGAGMNKFVLSENDQKYEQAKRDFINANLRQESGAAIAESEFDNADKQYFPQAGDTQAVISQKSRNRKLAVKGLNSNAGKAKFSSDSPTNGASDDIHAQAAAILGGK